MENHRTNNLDWPALVPVLPGTGPRRAALQLALRRLIETGQLPPGAQLPPSRTLAEQLSISRGAVVAAFEQLIADGYAEARLGAGTFVARAVPHIAPPARKPPAGSALLPILPGRLGSAMVDARSMAVFRKLLLRHLSRPVARHLHYDDPRGAPALREAIAAYLRGARAVRVHADQIVITSGAQQAIDLVLRAALRPGDAVWIENPAYPMAAALLRGAGHHIIPLQVDSEGLDVEAGMAAAPNAKAVYVTPSHQFPLGVVMSMRRRLDLLGWARATGAWIIEDDYDSEFRYAGPPLASLQGIDNAGRVIYIGTFSKALFPGLRTGFAVLPEALLGQVVALRERTDRYPSTLAEGALAAFLAEGHFATHLRRARKRAREARDAFVAELAHGPLRVVAPDQGLHLIADLPAWLDEDAAIAAAEQARLSARPLSAMYLVGPPRKGLVIGFSGFTPDVFAAAGKALAIRLGEINSTETSIDHEEQHTHS